MVKWMTPIVVLNVFASLCRYKCAVKCGTIPLLPAGETAGLHEENGFQCGTGKENGFRATGEAF